MRNRGRQRGFTLTELMVGLGMFGAIGLGMASISSSVLRDIAMEGRASTATQGLKGALDLLSTEMRMSSSLSPYLVGTSAAAVTCNSAFYLTSSTLRFMVVQDESAAATSGLQPYYVGYWYDPGTRRLLRGEIPGTTISSCTLPAGDPASATYATVLAENVVRVDGNGDGIADAAFTASGSTINVNLGVEIAGPNGVNIVQPLPVSIMRRTS